jgi:hypothetical protein
MSSGIYQRLGIAAVVMLGCGAEAAAQHQTALTHAPNRFYPNGGNISQQYVKPDANDSTLMGASATPGHVASSAAVHNLMSQSRNKARVLKELSPVLRSQTRVLLPADLGKPSLNADAITAAPALYKFTYGYQYKGVPLWRYSSQSQLIHVKNGTRKTLLIRERNTPNVDRLGDDLSVNAAESGTATKVGLDDSKGATTATLAIDEKNEAPHPEIHVDAQGNSQLALAFVVRSADRAQPFARRYWVAAKGDQKVLAKEDMIYHAQDATPATSTSLGQVTGNFTGFKLSPFDPPAKNQPLNNFRVEVTGTGGEVDTDPNGFYSPVAGGHINLKLAGPYCTIVNEAGGLLQATRSGNNLFFNARTEGELAQVSAFKWVSNAHAFVAEFVKGNDDRLKGLPTHVNINQTCNAFFDPTERTLNFFKAGDGCADSAYCDVASHEFGHAVDDQFGDILDGGYSEGFGDSLAILITHTSIIGRDFQGKDQPPLRDGRIYGGFTWELTRQLIKKLGNEDQAFAVAKQLVLAAAALNPKDTPDAVRLSFLVDKQNGSQFFAELAAAADSRKIPRPASPAAVDDLSAATASSQ